MARPRQSQPRRQQERQEPAARPLRHARAMSEDEESEEAGGDEEMSEEEPEEGDNGGDDGDSDRGEQLWGLKETKKLPVSEGAKQAANKLGKEDIKRKAQALVRLALFSEHRKSVIKRDDITKKALGQGHGRIFPIVFNRAQKMLRFIFGYEMVELRARGADNEQITNAQMQNGQDAEQAAAKGQSAAKTYIVVSILPEALTCRISEPDAELAQAFRSNDSRASAGIERDSKGALVDWDASSSDLGKMALTFIILSIILLNGRSLTDDRLRSYLRRLSLRTDKALPRSFQPHPETLRNGDEGITTEAFLNALVRHAYLERIQVQGAQPTSTTIEASLAGKRTQARASMRGKNRAGGNDGTDAIEEFEWRWGARAEAEVSEQAVAAFVSDVWFDVEDGDDELLAGRPNADQMSDDEAEPAGENTLADHRKKRKAQLMRDIEHAAGSSLIV